MIFTLIYNLINKLNIVNKHLNISFISLPKSLYIQTGQTLSFGKETLSLWGITLYLVSAHILAYVAITIWVSILCIFVYKASGIEAGRRLFV